MSEDQAKVPLSDKLTKMVKVAKLDQSLALIGSEDMTLEDAKAQNKMILPRDFDLPTDGTYKWVPGVKAFYPLGLGFDRPTRPPVDRDHAFYALIKTLESQGITIPLEASQWAEWYSTNDLIKAEEMTIRQKKLSQRRTLRGDRK